MEPNSSITRPLFRYLGGKYKIAPWIISFFPEHKTYVEPFGGGASVLLRKTPSEFEVYNDVNESIVTVFRVLRDRKKANELWRRLRLTPFSRTEFYAAYVKNEEDDDIERARKILVRTQMAVGSVGATRESRSGFRSTPTKNPVPPYVAYRKTFDAFINRLEGVLVENMDSLRLISLYDGKDTLFYCDPPYVSGTWNTSDERHCYGEFSYDTRKHEELCLRLREISGMCLLSGYDNEVYNDLLPGWKKEHILTTNQRSESRTEVLWMNPAVVEREKPNSLERFL